MKKLIITLTFIPLFLFSQKIELDEKTGLYAQTEVLEFEGLSKEDLFNKTIEWVTLNYNSANDVVQLKDKENGKIIVKGNMAVRKDMGQSLIISHTLIFEFKENRFKYDFTNFSSFYRTASGNEGSPMNFESEKYTKRPATMRKLNDNIESTEFYINQLIQSLIEFINTDDSDDW